MRRVTEGGNLLVFWFLLVNCLNVCVTLWVILMKMQDLIFNKCHLASIKLTLYKPKTFLPHSSTCLWKCQ